MEVATATHTKTEGAPHPPEEGTTTTGQSRIAHTLTACCRCRTVSIIPGTAGYVMSTDQSPAQDEMRPRTPSMRAMRAHQFPLRIL